MNAQLRHLEGNAERPVNGLSHAGERVLLIGIPIDCLTEEQVVDRIIADWRHGHGGWVVTPNVDHLRLLCRRAELKKTIAEAATLMLADGAPLLWASKLQGTPIPERVPGSQLIVSLTAAAAKTGASVFLLGGTAGAGERAAAWMVQAYPRLKIAGILAPPMGFDREPKLVAEMKHQVIAARPDLIYSCFGFPKQEWVIQQLRAHLPGSWFLGLGGSLSMLSGEFRRAPRWMQRAGLEWMCRLVQEPRRLFKRYLIYDAPFALYLFATVLKRRWTIGEHRWQLHQMERSAAKQTSLRGAHSERSERLRIDSLHRPALAGISQTPGQMHSVKVSADVNEKLRDLLLTRYARTAGLANWWRVAARLRQIAWATVLVSSRTTKRLIDIIGATIVLLLLSPLLLVFAMLVKLTSAGPVFFKQKRVGERGRIFEIYKFRSMCQDAESRQKELLADNEMQGGVIFKIKRDPRITMVGAFMRRWSIDELPQLWNILKGDMSLVGPRPPLPSEVQLYTLTQRRRLDAIPGLTCIWQVSGRSEIPFEKQVELDVEYIESQSLKVDVKLLLQTVPAILQHRGAY